MTEPLSAVLDQILRDYVDLGIRTVVKPAGIDQWWNTPIPHCDNLTPTELYEAGRVAEVAQRVLSYRRGH